MESNIIYINVGIFKDINYLKIIITRRVPMICSGIRIPLHYIYLKQLSHNKCGVFSHI